MSSAPSSTGRGGVRCGSDESHLITLSVVLCVNKSTPWLADAIRSVITQEDPDFEFLVAANACSDALWEELQILIENDCRVRLTRSNVGQLAFNLNLLADSANGDYLVRMDADDLCEPHRLAILREELSRDPVDVLGSAVTLIDENDEVVGQMAFPSTSEDIRRALPSRTVFCHPSVAIRREFLFSMRGYLGGFTSEDTDLWLRACRSGASLRNLPQALLRYRVHTGQSIASGRGYAEVASHWLRELLVAPGWYPLKGFAIALAKSIGSRFLPNVGRYLKANPRG